MSTEMSQMKKADKMIASRLEDWTYDIIKDMVDKSQGESVSHDFKANIPCFISNDKEISNIFGQKIHAVPEIYFDQPKIIFIPNSNKVLAIFHIPPSPRKPHIPSAMQERRFWKRTNAGNDFMEYDEIRRAFQTTPQEMLNQIIVEQYKHNKRYKSYLCNVIINNLTKIKSTHEINYKRLISETLYILNA